MVLMFDLGRIQYTANANKHVIQGFLFLNEGHLQIGCSFSVLSHFYLMYIDRKSVSRGITLNIVIAVAFTHAIIVIIRGPVRLGLLGNGHKIATIVIP